MNKHNQIGAVSGLALALLAATVLLIASVSFGVWAYNGRQKYKNNVEGQINTAVQTAIAKQESADNATFAKQSQFPLNTYNGPQAYGSVALEYPKSWSAYVDDTGQGGALVDGYFNPGIVPSIVSQTSVFALRFQIVNQTYSQVVQGIFNQSASQTSVSAYSLPKLPSVVGVEVSGQLPGQSSTSTGTMVILPIRTNTLEVWTQGTEYLSEFNSDILANLSFSP